jgi:HPt (histidine-containing phosphotransfer) domain-containing protein
MSEIAAKLEQQAKANKLEGVDELISELERILGQLKAFRNVN